MAQPVDLIVINIFIEGNSYAIYPIQAPNLKCIQYVPRSHRLSSLWLQDEAGIDTLRRRQDGTHLYRH